MYFLIDFLSVLRLCWACIAAFFFGGACAIRKAVRRRQLCSRISRITPSRPARLAAAATDKQNCLCICQYVYACVYVCTDRAAQDGTVHIIAPQMATHLLNHRRNSSHQHFIISYQAGFVNPSGNLRGPRGIPRRPRVSPGGNREVPGAPPGIPRPPGVSFWGLPGGSPRVYPWEVLRCPCLRDDI